MKILILNTDYPEFLHWLYARHPGLENQPYEEQMRARVESLFGVADFYSSNLRKLGHEAYDIHANNEFMQKAWAREHGVFVKEPAPVSPRWRETLQRASRVAARTSLRYLKPLFRPILRPLNDQQTWFYDLLAAQIKHYKPDVLLNQAMDGINTSFLREIKPYVRLLVGQIASPLPQEKDFDCYDLVISSLPNFVDYFRRIGIPSELNRLAFESRVLERLEENNRAIIPVSFVGSLFQAHTARIRWLEYLCRRLDVKVWGQGIDALPKNSPIRQRYMGKAWGIEMYQILHRSKITLNYHIDVAGSYANNMRLYEATGMGACLVTDWKENLHELFELEKEVVTYRSADELVEKVNYLLAHDKERAKIAKAGQERTLKEHNYYNRMKELLEILKGYVEE